LIDNNIDKLYKGDKNMSYDRYTDIMSAFFSGKLKDEIVSANKGTKKVELGHGTGIGYKDGTYDVYAKKLSENKIKGNGTIYIGKDINTDGDTLSIQCPTEKFSTEDVPKLLIMFNTILNPIQIRVVWKNSDDEIISDQYYEIPSAHSMNYDWWESYGVYFIGPEDLEEGYYNINIMSKELGLGDKIKTLSAYVELSVLNS
jgi:hypothetical protein